MLRKSELTIYLTSKCNLACTCCYTENGKQELSIDDLNWIFQYIDNKRTTFLGGEPLLYPHLKEALELFPQITISTNGILLNENNVGLLTGVNGVQLCLHPETMIQLSNGTIKKISEANPTNVIGYNFESMKYQHGKSTCSLRNSNEIVEIKTRTTNIRVTPNHLFPIIDDTGYKDVFASNLKKNDFLLSPKYISFIGKRQKLPTIKKIPMDNTSKNISLPEYTTDDFMQFLGYYIGDGLNTSKTHRNYILLIDKSKNILEGYKKLGESIFGLHGELKKHKKQNSYLLSFNSSLLRRFFAEIDIPRSNLRRVPNIVQKNEKKQLARFIAGFCDAEGCITNDEIQLASSSKDMLHELQFLLKRFGIIASLREKKKRKIGFGEGYICYSLNVSSPASIKSFSKNIGDFMLSQEKKEKLKKLLQNCKISRYYECYPIATSLVGIFKTLNLSIENCNLKKKVTEDRVRDILTFLENKIADKDIPVLQREIGTYLGESPQNISDWIGKKINNRVRYGQTKLNLNTMKNKSKEKIILNAVDSIIGEKIKKAMSKIKFLYRILDDFYFDEIVNIKRVAYNSPVYDISVPEVRTFIANGLITHNSTGIGEVETNAVRGEGVWDRVLQSAKLLERENIKYYFRVSFWEGNLVGLKELDDMNAPLVLFPRIDKPVVSEVLMSKLFETVLMHDNWVLALPNFMQYIGKNRGRCKAGKERLNVLYNKKITPCNLDLEYYLGKVGEDTDDIERNVENYLETNKVVPSECLGCKNVETCRGSCYAAHVSTSCPLRYDFSIETFMFRNNISASDMRNHTLRIADFMKNMLVC